MSRRRRAIEGAAGASLAEFALVLPLILLLMLGLFDGGRAVINFTTLTNAARAGARVAVVNQSNDASCSGERTFKCAAADVAISMGIAPASIPDLVVTGSDCASTGSCTVTVTLSYPMQMVTPVVGALIGPFTLTASTTMPMERTYVHP